MTTTAFHSGRAIGEVRIEKSDDMLANAWVAYDFEGRTVAMGALGMGQIKMGDGPAHRITVGRATWHELMAATGGASPTATDLSDLWRSP